MSKNYRAVIIGSAHVHILEVAYYCFENERVDLVACADVKPEYNVLDRAAIYTRKWNLNYVSETYGLKIYDDYLQMLDTEKPDLAVITSENALHAGLVEICAERGIAVSVEKPMATSLSEGMKMVRSARKHGTLLMINWPIAWRQYYYQLKKLLAEGKIGELKRIRHFAGNTGAMGRGARHRGVKEYAEDMSEDERALLWWHQSERGGGAMLDFCGYGCLSSYWLVGEPALAAVGMRYNASNPWGNAEDNAGMMVMFPDCMATLEGTWTAPGVAVPPGPELYGTEGVLICEREADNVHIKYTSLVGETQIIEPEYYPSVPKNIADAFVRHMDDGTELPEMVQSSYNIKALAILDAGIKSTGSGKFETVRNEIWEIG